GFDPEFDYPPDMEATINSLQLMGIDKFNQDMVNEERLAPVFALFFKRTFNTFRDHPEIIDLLDQADLIADMFDVLARRYFPIVRLFPIVSKETIHLVPYLKEPLFTALYELPEEEHDKLTHLTEKVMYQIYKKFARPRLANMVRHSLKGRNLLLPLIDE